MTYLLGAWSWRSSGSESAFRVWRGRNVGWSRGYISKQEIALHFLARKIRASSHTETKSGYFSRG